MCRSPIGNRGEIGVSFAISRAADVIEALKVIVRRPGRIDSEAFDIEATTAQGTVPAELPQKERDPRIMLRLQTLLADRFKLATRRETREPPYTRWWRPKNGPKLQKGGAPCEEIRQGKDTVPCHNFTGAQGRGIPAKSAGMADLVGFLKDWTDGRPCWIRPASPDRSI